MGSPPLIIVLQSTPTTRTPRRVGAWDLVEVLYLCLRKISRKKRDEKNTNKKDYSIEKNSNVLDAHKFLVGIHYIADISIFVCRIT